MSNAVTTWLHLIRVIYLSFQSQICHRRKDTSHRYALYILWIPHLNIQYISGSICIYTFNSNKSMSIVYENIDMMHLKTIFACLSGHDLITLNFYYNMEYICFFILTSPDQEINFVMIVKNLILTFSATCPNSTWTDVL